MNVFYRRIELVANITIIAVALLLGIVLVKRYVLSSPTANRSLAAKQENIKPGTKISLPDVDWSKKDTHLVLVLQQGCHFCTESAPFYQRLVKSLSSRTDLELIAALPQDVNVAKQYLDELQVPIGEVRQSSLSTIGVRGTPTLLLVDKTGTITDAWVGKLPPDKESEVFNRLQVKL
jgi:thioredoxin-related protein